MADSREDMIKQWEEHNKITVDGVQYTPSELEASHKRSGENIDPYTNAFNTMSTMASRQAPRVSVNNGDVVIEAPESVMQSPIIEQLNKELQSLKGADLNSAEVKNAINALNEEIQTNWKNSLINQSTGWTPEEYKDYQYTMQTVSGTNPMKSSNKIKGKTKEGVVTAKTPQEWVNYWREVYNTQERNDAFLKSLNSKNPYERTMALVMGQGGSRAVYGFDGWEKLGQFNNAFWNEVNKTGTGAFKGLFSGFDMKRVYKFQEELGVPTEAFKDLSITNEDQFNAMKNSIKGKTWKDLNDKQKAFIIELGVSKENPQTSSFDREVWRGTRTPMGSYAKDLDNMSSENEANSKEAIGNILLNNTFDRYKQVRDDFDTWTNYDENVSQGDIDLEKNSSWAAAAQTAGKIPGTIVRFLHQAALMQAATGGASGVNMNAISDTIGGKIVSTLAKHGISPASKAGQNLLQFSANLIGTIPEDIVQTSVDNILTDNAKENEHLFDWDQMSGNFKSNLITMTLFNAAREGVSAVARAKLAKQAAKAADFNTIVNLDGVMLDTDELARAVKRGDRLNVDNGKVSTTSADGTETVYKNLSPESGRYIQQSLLDADNPKAKDIEGADVESAKLKFDEDGNLIDDGGPKKYDLEGLDTQLRVRVEPTPAGIRSWHQKAIKTMMKVFEKHLDEFHTKFPGVQASDFDWIWYQTKFNKLTPDQIVGTVDPSTGRTMTKKMIEAAQWWGEQPFTRDLRLASREAIGEIGDENILGYLPHTDYNPSNLSPEEAITGALWKTSTGASITGPEGEYKGFGDADFTSRYNTFASNMLWDARSKDVAASKIIEELALDDGQPITPETVEKVYRSVEGARDIRKLINESPTLKSFVKAFDSTADLSEAELKEIYNNWKKDADRLGIGKAKHDNGDFYAGYNSKSVTHQRKGFINSFDTLRNFMKRTVIGGDMNLYDWGGADMVYAPRNAIFIVNRWTREGGGNAHLRELLTEYVQKHSHRSAEYAEVVVDKWMGKLAETQIRNGNLSKAMAINSLSSSMKWEASNRINKWLAMAKYDEFNVSTRKNIDRFLFNYMQMDGIKTHTGFTQMMSKLLDKATSARYDALFYGNIKNALLQVSELNRYFSQFKWGDVAVMAKRLATDEGFRAKVDDFLEAVAPMDEGLKAELRSSRHALNQDALDAYAEVASGMKVKENGVVFEKIKDAKKAADAIGLAPINAAESFKNRMMVAGLVQEAERLKLTGDEALRHIRNRFEEVALAADEMGRIGLSTNPYARPFLFLQSFQIRELGMHLYNILDKTGLTDGITAKGVFEAGKYLTKVLGAKMATTLLLARLGYSASQTLGIDPFNLLGNYNTLNDEDMEGLDYVMLSPLFAGGMLSLISDTYFMARNAYENSQKETSSEEAEQHLGSSYGLSFDDMFSSNGLWNLAQNFIPGSTTAKRIGQMNDMMDSGWAVSQSGTKMYTAPDDMLNTVLGYLFGRSATQNAQQYNQTYGDNLWQTLGRFNPFRKYGDFDPIDSTNYTDWFKGDGNDAQQFNKGLYYFRNERDKVLNAYSDAIKNSRSQTDISEAQNDMNYKLNEIFTKLERFTEAYENKNGSITPAMVKQILNVLNTNVNTFGTESERNERGLEEYNKALERYSALGFSPVGTYSGAYEDAEGKHLEDETKYQGSPQWRTAANGRYKLSEEVVDVLKLADEKLKPIRDSLKDSLSAAYNKKNYNEVERIQRGYLKDFDNVVSPIVAAYGNSIFTSADVTEQIKAMLSTSDNTRSGNLIPSDDYRKDKYGRYRSMPYETVDVKKWAQQRFRSNTYQNPTVTTFSTVNEDIDEIRQLDSQGQKDRARAKALQLQVRVDKQMRALSKEQKQWLDNYLKGDK